jgi:serine/threonine protein kinase
MTARLPPAPTTLVTMVDRPAPAVPDKAATGGVPAAHATDRYVLDREIAQGGMGRVFLGRDRRLGREVAVKVLLDDDPALARRFEREARVAARLQHPGIVTVYDAGFWPTGEPYLVMKHVLGHSLERVIAEAESRDERLALLPHIIAIADALAYAHDRGIVHRDLKPSNVVVGAFGETVVVDWGLAKQVGEVDDPPPTREPEPAGAGLGISMAGAVVGTPAYMAPEQAAGQAIDVRADVYALGAMLTQLLVGEQPGDPEPRAPADLQAIVAKAMAADRNQRYPSAFELAEDLKRFQTGQLVAARHYSLAIRVGRWTRKHPGAVAVPIVALALWLLRHCS